MVTVSRVTQPFGPEYDDGYIIRVIKGKANVAQAIIQDCGFVNNILVYKRYRGHGFGTQLMEGIIKQAKKMRLTKIGLHAPSDNPAAMAILNKFGFMPNGFKMNDEDEYYLYL